MVEGRRTTLVCHYVTEQPPTTLEATLSSADIVFLVASYGMSGVEMLNFSQTRRVNVDGTHNVLQACITSHVPILIYTSSVNVVFGGQPIENADETYPVYPLNEHTDEYSRTKAIAESAILAANGTKFSGEAGDTLQCSAPLSSILLTAAIRTNGIYGEGEERHFKRIVNAIKLNALFFRYGYPNNLVDWTHVDNLALSHMLAAVKLIKDAAATADTNQDSITGKGTAYFVSDGDPRNNFALLQETLIPLYKMYGPFFSVPLPIIYRTGYFLELSFRLLSPYLRFPTVLLLTRAEVSKSGQHHTFNISKIRRELGYQSVTNTLDGFRAMVTYLEVADRNAVHRTLWQREPRLKWWVALFGVVLGLGLLRGRPALRWWRG
ncbi:hypothetical protein M427DRAFT_156987 [Gonapodya prolifera JEL478]|uniref:3-beta hydroxysteroid dehydrogenase/isomerase domain-containing protein n=1 Tax=Gonapodya prolifera (strain JEL478) TaxID=1344416 RepID=A0A139A8E9_GONPJ|nr:hypothetical protein M427DRAFT_156987 [Gonapodya prolifera JEL478]|eukprot:KXS12958.1 hypothetical protein M427DRAFT_156987 [Gonapodya prolifera JEL478]